MNALPPPTTYAPAAGPSDTYLPTSTASPDTPEEAGEAFEKILARRFVETMTKHMFDSGLSGKAGPAWMQSQRNHQRKVLTDVLADHIVEANTLGISEMLLREWGLASEPNSPELSAEPSAHSEPASRASPLEPVRPARLKLL